MSSKQILIEASQREGRRKIFDVDILDVAKNKKLKNDAF